MSSRIIQFVMFVLLVATRVAHAGDSELYLQVKPADPTDPKQKGKAPSIEATVVGQPKVPLDKFSISTTHKGQKITLKAEKIREYTEGTETVAIAFVVNGQQIWIGNDEYAPEGTGYAGVLKPLQGAMDKLQIANAGPPGSKGMLVSFSNGATIKVPMGDLKNITGAALGGQKDYEGKFNTDMVQGITTGIAELSKTTTARKVLVVIGDGVDTNPDGARAMLKDLKEQARKQNIQLFGVMVKSAITKDENIVLPALIPTAKLVTSSEGIASELNAIIARLADRYYLTFPGYDPKLKLGLPWDGKEHDLTLKIDQTELEPATIALAPVWNPPSKGGFPWLVVILVVVGLLVIIIIGVKVFGQKSVPAPAPVPMPVMPVGMPMPEAPRPAAPMKTVMIGAGGDEGGFPIVGWIVAINGVDAYKTQRLKPGMTKIGTGPASDIVVNDGFMSTEHCHIQSSPAGFVLVDNNATNGTYVNDRKVQKHELVDNDTITLGKTSFKFKSIN